MIVITALQFAFISALYFAMFFYSLLLIYMCLRRILKKLEMLINTQCQRIQVSIQNELKIIYSLLNDITKENKLRQSTSEHVLYADIAHVNNLPISERVRSMANNYDNYNHCNDYMKMSYKSKGGASTNYDLNMNIKCPLENACNDTHVYDIVPIRTYANLNNKDTEKGYVKMSCVSTTDKKSNSQPHMPPIYEEIKQSENGNKLYSPLNSFGKSTIMPIYEEISELKSENVSS